MSRSKQPETEIGRGKDLEKLRTSAGLWEPFVVRVFMVSSSLAVRTHPPAKPDVTIYTSTRAPARQMIFSVNVQCIK